MGVQKPWLLTSANATFRSTSCKVAHLSQSFEVLLLMHGFLSSKFFILTIFLQCCDVLEKTLGCNILESFILSRVDAKLMELEKRCMNFALLFHYP